MNDFDNGSINGSTDDAVNENAKENVNDNTASSEKEGVKFNADGTYHGVHENGNPYYDAAHRENTDNAHGQNQGNYGGYQQSGGYNSYNDANRRYNYPPDMNRNYNQYARNNPYQGYNANSQYDPNARYNPYTQNQDAYAYSDENDNNGKDGKKKKSKSAKILAIIAGCLCVVLVAALIAIAVGDNTDVPSGSIGDASEDASQNVEEFETSASPVTGEESAEGVMTPKAIYNNVLASSVGILVYDKSKTLASEGSGVFFQTSDDGKYTYIVTCAHVISETSGKIRVQTYDSKEYDAEVVGFDARTDIGVLRVAETGFQLADIGDSSQISVGDYVYAIGNPGGVEFANSFTNGMVSALDRPVNSSSTGYTTECIQHTAAINPGNSGGALVNAFGQVVGINSMKIVADEYEGMGFAVPSSVFVKIVNDILANGYVANRPKLGITYVPATEYSNYGMFVAIKGLPSGSIVIYSISEDSSLASSEVQEGDMIVSVNGKDLDDPSYLSELIENSDVGDTLTLGIVRINDDYSYEEFEAKVTLVEDRGDTFAVQEEEASSDSYFGDNYGDSYGSYEDYFDDFFNEYFGDRFGGFAP